MRRSCGVRSAGVAGRKAPQQHGVARLGLRHAALALRRRGGRIESQHLVDELEVPIVVDEALLGGDLGIHADPEAHVRLELRRMRERIRRARSRPVPRRRTPRPGPRHGHTESAPASGIARQSWSSSGLGDLSAPRSTRTSSRRSSGTCCSRPSSPPRPCCTSRRAARPPENATWRTRPSAWRAPRTPRASGPPACAGARRAAGSLSRPIERR